MKTFICAMFLVAAALAAPEGKRDKRGYFHSDFHTSHVEFPSYELDHHHYHEPIEHASFIESAHIVHKPVHKLVAIKKVVEVPRIVEIKKVVSIPKLITVPKIVTAHKLVEDHSHSHSHYSPSFSHVGHGWW